MGVKDRDAISPHDANRGEKLPDQKKGTSPKSNGRRLSLGRIPPP